MSRHRSGSRPYQFGQDGTKEVEWKGDLPSPSFGPYESPKKYLFREGKNPRCVDLRDLPFLVKEAGRENLQGKGLPRAEKPKAGKSSTQLQEVKTNADQ